MIERRETGSEKPRLGALRRQLGGFCVALLVVLASPGCVQGVGAGDLVLASWNLEHLAAADGAGCRPRERSDYAELARIGASLGAQVIALQEVENEAAVARVFPGSDYDIVLSGRPASELGNCRRRSGQARTQQRTGFAIHRAALAAIGLTWRPAPPFSGIGIDGVRWGTRILLEPIAGGHDDAPAPIELVSLHLKSGCAWNRLSGKGLRRAQCRILMRQRGILEDWIDARAADDGIFVLIGDFNRQLDQPDDDFWREIDDAEICRWRPDPELGAVCEPGSESADPDADLTLANAGVAFPYPFNPKYPYAVDHFVIGGPWERTLTLGGYAAIPYEKKPPPSDHHPIRLVLKLSGRKY